MKILFISYYSPPYNCMGSIRLKKMLSVLSKNKNIEIKVIAAYTKELSADLNDSYDNVDFIRIDAINLRKKAEIYQTNSNQASSIVKMKLISIINFFYLNFFPELEWFWVQKTKKISLKKWTPDIVYSSSLPISNAIVGDFFSKKYHVPHVMEMRDHWSQSQYNKRTKLRRIFDSLLERKLISRSDIQIGVTESLTQYLQHKGGNAYTIYTGFEKIKIPSINSEGDLRKHKRKKIIYTGMIYPNKRDPTFLIKILSKHPKLINKFELHFFGKGFNFLRSNLSKEETKVCFFHDSVPYDEVILHQQEADILLLLSWNNNFEKGVIGGKLFEYISARKPILHLGCCHGEISNIINKYNLGVTDTPDFLNKKNIVDFLLNPKIKNSSKEILKLSSDYQFNKLYDIIGKFLDSSTRKSW